MNEVIQSWDMLEYISVATVVIPFLVGALKDLLAMFGKEVQSQTLVGLVCVILGGAYAALTTFGTPAIISTVAAVTAVTFATSQGIYKMWKKG